MTGCEAFALVGLVAVGGLVGTGVIFAWLGLRRIVRATRFVYAFFAGDAASHWSIEAWEHEERMKRTRHVANDIAELKMDAATLESRVDKANDSIFAIQSRLAALEPKKKAK